jgi:sulfonate transport system substrate-binding protein
VSPLPRLRPRGAVIAVLSAVLLLAAACSDEASTRAEADDGPTTTAAAVVTPPSVPPGTTLRIGDQLEYLQTVLSVSGQDEDLPYTVEYANFVGGPPMLQAFQGGAIDAGFVASTPLIFAQAAGQEIVAVAGWAPENGLGGLISADPDIGSWKDLKGRRVAYQRGTSAEAAVLTALDEAGLSPSDIETVDVPITQVASTIKSGSADAGISTEPLISGFIKDTPGGRLVEKANDITDRGSFLIASREALADEARSAALADYVTRLVRAFAYLAGHKEQLAESIFVGQYGLTPERTPVLATSTGVTTFLELPGDVAEPQQQLADRFQAAGQIPTKIDTSREFDTRFNELIRQTAEEVGVAAQGGAGS